MGGQSRKVGRNRRGALTEKLRGLGVTWKQCEELLGYSSTSLREAVNPMFRRMGYTPPKQRFLNVLDEYLKVTRNETWLYDRLLMEWLEIDRCKAAIQASLQFAETVDTPELDLGRHTNIRGGRQSASDLWAEVIESLRHIKKNDRPQSHRELFDWMIAYVAMHFDEETCDQKICDLPLDVLDLSIPLRNALHYARIKVETLGDLADKTPEEVKSIKYMTEKAFAQANELLESHGLAFAET